MNNTKNIPSLAPAVRQLLAKGTVIPAHPLALCADRSLDEDRQRQLTRYYLAAGAGGLAVGVHTTQFAIRNPEINLFEKVLAMAMEEVNRAELDRPLVKVAGVSGPTSQAVREAELAKDLGYDLALVSSNGLGLWREEELLERAQELGAIMPLFGFYLQPAVGGKLLSRDFWEKFAEIPSVLAIKIAPFNRYQTLDVVQAVCQSSRRDEISLYTGNDDNIVADLLSTYEVATADGTVRKDIVGGLLGHWAVWTRRAVQLLERIHELKATAGYGIPAGLLTEALQVTDTNAAFFDAQNNFAGCIAGIHEVLRRQGLLAGTWCLDPEETLSPGQAEEIDRVYRAYPELNDDDFVRQFLREK
ncbi:dihydrodipicolinate synthase family protein [Flavilitoribacter nigricans]|uniref:Dihydrodipicolinate synthase family protein n=1 Tax=Flavilitoribacter nigricans (strain ATCC 23147 / DSM 23189 / NBRC 102662 / NCIMB 1420 / SS-2) TaxID=1122177 RepID=A0A2D0NE14_FLAN2|nr:dihydrodipicolinate synthase family protein [Flavilitoribacter nigricans]PHN06616.1 dihydrodipicolinate synthase family protein [Flavilitoribacter nigricans DSM 23189 = NBRC 102662]